MEFDTDKHRGERFLFYCNAVPDASILSGEDANKGNFFIEFTKGELDEVDFNGLACTFDHNTEESFRLGRVVNKIQGLGGGVNLLVEVVPEEEIESEKGRHNQHLKDIIVTNIINGKLNRVSLAHLPLPEIETPTGLIQSKRICEVSVSYRGERDGSDILTHYWSKTPYTKEDIKYEKDPVIISGVEVTYHDAAKKIHIGNSDTDSPLSTDDSTMSTPVLVPPLAAAAQQATANVSNTSVATPAINTNGPALVVPPQPQSQQTKHQLDIAALIVKNKELEDKAMERDTLFAELEKTKKEKADLIPIVEQYTSMVREKQNQKKREALDATKQIYDQQIKRAREFEVSNPEIKKQADEYEKTTKEMSEIQENLYKNAEDNGQVSLSAEEMHNFIMRQNHVMVLANGISDEVKKGYDNIQTNIISQRGDKLIMESKALQSQLRIPPLGVSIPAAATVATSQPQQPQQFKASLVPVGQSRLNELTKQYHGALPKMNFNQSN